MKTLKKQFLSIIIVLSMLVSTLSLMPVITTAMVDGFSFDTSDMITDYFGSSGTPKIPDKTKGVNDYAFYRNRSRLTAIIINKSTPIIFGDLAFYGCEKLKTVYVPVGSKSLYEEVSQLKGLDIIEITFEEDLGFVIDVIDDENILTGYNGSNPVVAIPDTVTRIDDRAFAFLTNIIEVIIPENVKTIGKGAFVGCTRISEITIPNTVSEIGEGAFSYCTGLSTITVDGENNSFSSVDGVLFNKNGDKLITYPEGKSNDTYTMSNTTSTIGEYAFLNSTLNSIIFENAIPPLIEDNAFYGCNNLKTICAPIGAKGEYEKASQLNAFDIVELCTTCNVFPCICSVCDVCNDSGEHCTECCEFEGCGICDPIPPICSFCNDSGEHCTECCDIEGCEICDPVTKFNIGDVNGDINVTIDDALEILMYLAEVPQSIIFTDETGLAKNASIIIDPNAEEPTISDALDILMFLAEMEQSRLYLIYSS